MYSQDLVDGVPWRVLPVHRGLVRSTANIPGQARKYCCALCEHIVIPIDVVKLCQSFLFFFSFRNVKKASTKKMNAMILFRMILLLIFNLINWGLSIYGVRSLISAVCIEEPYNSILRKKCYSSTFWKRQVFDFVLQRNLPINLQKNVFSLYSVPWLLFTSNIKKSITRSIWMRQLYALIEWI